MQIVLCDDAEHTAREAAKWVQALLVHKAQPVLGLATGSTPIRLYQALIQLYQQQKLSFANCTTFNLDEYFDIAPEHKQSYRSFMQTQLFSHIDIDLKQTHLPTCTQGQNPRLVGMDYEQQIAAAGGIDLQILGIGSNGHIGFNEPTSSLASRTRLKTLTAQTMADNSRLFAQGEIQPTMAMTMGIATIMDARYVLLIATGLAKAEAVRQMVCGPVSAYCPASMLQMHEHAIVVLDKDAASLISDQQYLKVAEQENQRMLDIYGLQFIAE
jgi:glucosamine-6-phosphate deaminase